MNVIHVQSVERSGMAVVQGHALHGVFLRKLLDHWDRSVICSSDGGSYSGGISPTTSP